MVSQKNGFVNTFFVKKAKYAKKSVPPALKAVLLKVLWRKMSNRLSAVF